MPNQVFIDIVSKGPDIAGKPLSEVLPELKNQSFLQILDDVYTSGKMFQSFGSPANIVQNGIMTTSYYNVAFTPLLDNEGKTYAILGISINVTEAVKSRQKLEEAQRILQDAVELAQLATWTIDAVSGLTEYSERMKSWLGVSESGRTLKKGLESLPTHEREPVAAALQWAMNPKSGGLFDMEYGIIDQVTGLERIIHAQARTFFDAEDKPLKLVGTALDVTEQRNTKLALEHEVQERTEELDAANEELRATNEEFQTINEELAHLNDALERSNESLQQFAHVASHDLKEPVRKIKIFLGMIESDPGTVLSSNARVLMERVNTAANRMFSMINGVLVYSTVNANEHPVEQVNPEKITEQIIIDLEMIIAQKKATIHYKNLPLIEGAEILIYQLFSNFIINSLKFSKPDIPPVIELSASPVIKNRKHFTEIKVSDNGVGFESHQSEKIFHTFARLHSKDKYEGTGLGPSLCQKIVHQHGGTIEAAGKAGEGALFTIRLPLRQSNNII